MSRVQKIQNFRDKCRLLKSHLHQRNFFPFPQMKALIDSIEIQVDDIPIILFSSVFDGVLQEFSNGFQDFERISDITRLVTYLHLVKTETAPLNLQMELVVVVVYSTPSERWGHVGRPWSPRSRATPQGLDQRS